MISPVQSAATAPTSANPAQGSGAAIGSDFNTFLKMLTVQMKNQDPMNPIESSDYAVQLATFSGVEQQVKTNDLLNNLVKQMGQMGVAQLAGWVGMEARAAAPAWFDGGPVTVAPNPPQGSDVTALVAYNAAGAEVSRTQIPVSSDNFVWDGKAANGSTLPTGLYTFKLEAYRGGAIVSNTQTEVYSKIIEARGENGGTILVLEGGAKVPSDSVTALRAPVS